MIIPKSQDLQCDGTQWFYDITSSTIFSDDIGLDVHAVHHIVYKSKLLLKVATSMLLFINSVGWKYVNEVTFCYIYLNQWLIHLFTCGTDL